MSMEPSSDGRGSPQERTDVVVIGAGVVGLALALDLSRRGIKAVVLERGDTPGSSLSSGRVDAQGRPSVEPQPVRDLALFSRELYADWIESIEYDTGLSTEYDARGGLTVALTEDEEARLDRALDWQRSRQLPFEILAAAEARLREGALGPGVRGAFAFPLDGQVSPEGLCRALVQACRLAGAQVSHVTTALGLTLEGERLTGVETTGGRIRADAVVAASGAIAPCLANAPPAPIAHFRSLVLGLDASADPGRLTRFVSADLVSLVPRRDGSLRVHSAFERAGFDDRPTAFSVVSTLSAVMDVIPAARDYPLTLTRSVRSAASPDGVPLLGETALPGYFLAVGHLGSAVAMAPASASLLAELLSGEEPSLDPAPFSPARFGV
jgi:glycine oxidase